MTVQEPRPPGIDPVLQTVVRSAVEATGASDGWLAAVDEGADKLVVVAGEGPVGRTLLGMTVGDDDGFTGYVVGSGQPLALSPKADDPRFAEGLTARLGRRPRTILCVPCEDDDVVVGALELVDKAGGAFSVDDLELAGVLADVAAVALRLGAGGPSLVPTPAELAALLENLSRTDAVRYALLAELVASLARHG